MVVTVSVTTHDRMLGSVRSVSGGESDLSLLKFMVLRGAVNDSTAGKRFYHGEE